MKVCPCCECESEGEFPADARISVQYGSRIKGLWVYLNQYQLLPYQRLAQLSEVLYGHRPSVGSLVRVNEISSASQ